MELSTRNLASVTLFSISRRTPEDIFTSSVREGKACLREWKKNRKRTETRISDHDSSYFWNTALKSNTKNLKFFKEKAKVYTTLVRT